MYPNLNNTGLYSAIKLPNTQAVNSYINQPKKQIVPAIPQAAIPQMPMGLSSTGGLWDFMKNNPAQTMYGVGSLTQGLGGLYSGILGGRYAKTAADALDDQMRLYEDEIARQNQTRESYSTAFSGGN
jgi:hypothetical protein